MTCLTYFEPLTNGHCAFWAKVVLQTAVRDARITRLRLVASGELIERLANVVSASEIEVEMLSTIELMNLTEGRFRDRGQAQWVKARELLARGGGQLFLPFFDHALYGSILDRRPVAGQISGIVFRPPNNFNLPDTPRQRLNALRRWVSYFAARRPALRALFTLDECASETPISRALKLLHHIPDPAPDLADLVSKTAASKAPMRDRRVALVFGALTKRKGIFRMLEAVAHLSTAEQGGLELRFVGRLDANDRADFMEAFSATRQSNPHVALALIDRYVSDTELSAEVADCDVVFAPYQNHVGSSGVVYWSVAAGKPLVSQNTGFMGWQVERYRLGRAVDTTSPRALARALVQRLPLPTTPATFLSRHRPEIFARTILDRLL